MRHARPLFGSLIVTCSKIFAAPSLSLAWRRATPVASVGSGIEDLRCVEHPTLKFSDTTKQTFPVMKRPLIGMTLLTSRLPSELAIKILLSDEVEVI